MQRPKAILLCRDAACCVCTWQVLLVDKRAREAAGCGLSQKLTAHSQNSPRRGPRLALVRAEAQQGTDLAGLLKLRIGAEVDHADIGIEGAAQDRVGEVFEFAGGLATARTGFH